MSNGKLMFISSPEAVHGLRQGSAVRVPRVFRQVRRRFRARKHRLLRHLPRKSPPAQQPKQPLPQAPDGPARLCGNRRALPPAAVIHGIVRSNLYRNVALCCVREVRLGTRSALVFLRLDGGQERCVVVPVGCGF